jgi:hypothetical protein
VVATAGPRHSRHPVRANIYLYPRLLPAARILRTPAPSSSPLRARLFFRGCHLNLPMPPFPLFVFSAQGWALLFTFGYSNTGCCMPSTVCSPLALSAKNAKVGNFLVGLFRPETERPDQLVFHCCTASGTANFFCGLSCFTFTPPFHETVSTVKALRLPGRLPVTDVHVCSHHDTDVYYTPMHTYLYSDRCRYCIK